MNWSDLLWLGDRGAVTPIESIVLSLLLAFVIGQIIGWVYMATHTTPSYSSSFVASLVVLPVIVSLMMVLMSGSLMIAFGLLAVFAVVRFRNVLEGHPRHHVHPLGRSSKEWRPARFAIRRRWLA